MRAMTALVAGVLTMGGLAGPAAAESYVYAGQWGTQGTGPGQFSVISGIAWEAGRVYVTDMVPLLTERVQVFDASGALIAEGKDWDEESGATGGVDVDAAGAIYTSVVDVFTKTDAAFTLLLRRGREDLSPPPALFRPTDVAVAPSGEILIAEMSEHRIARLSAAGDLLGTIGSQGAGDGQFSFVGGVAVAPDGSIYATDHLGNRVLRFSASGQFISAWGTKGAEPGQFTSPRGIDVDGAGNVYVADWIGQRVQKFTADGTFVCAFGEAGSANGEFNGPVDVAVAADGSAVYVADLLNYRVQRFDHQP